MNLQAPHSTTIAVVERGSAPWLTMVHAATHDQRYFSSQAQAFQRDYRLLLIDLPGHGKSAALPGPFGFEEYAVSVLAAMDAAGVETTHYLATHTGAAAGLILATRFPQRFLSLALESPPIPGVDLPAVVESFDRARATASSRGVDAARAEWYERSQWFDIIRKNPQRCRADEHWAMVSEFSGQPWLDATPARPLASLVGQLSSIPCPVLIINGEHDVDDFLHAAGELERRMPRVRRVSIPDAGGFPMWEDPEQVNDHIRRHLQDACMKS
jgi:pimeloyl-ACP methyl ester carboxylesterase